MYLFDHASFRTARRVISLALALVCTAFLAAALELDETPAGPGEWGYQPAEEATVAVNPPPFTWRPVRDAVGYRLSVAPDPDFNAPVIDGLDVPWAAHCPGAALAAGTYYWRYRAVDAAGEVSPASTVRTFTVPENAPQFPKPNRVRQEARIPDTHPRLFMRPEEVERYRELAAGPLAGAWAGVREAAGKLLENPPGATEPPKYPEGTEYKSEEWRKIWWGNRVYGISASNGAATLAFAWQITGDERYAAAGRDLLLAIMDWDPKGSTNYRYNDEAAMPLLYYPSRAYTWLHDFLTEEERARVREVMAVRGADCYNHLRGRSHLWRPYASHSNRAWHKLGELAIAFHGEIPEAAEWLDYGLTLFFTCYPVWGGADGGWHEGTAYWSSYISRFMYWAAISRNTLHIDVFEKPFFRETGYYGLYTLPPGSEAGAFADLAERTTSRGIATLMAQLAAGARNPHWQWYAEQHGASVPGGYFGMIAGAQAHGLAGRAPEDLPASRVFRDTGLAVLNSNLVDGAQNVQIHFKSSPWGRQSHGYNANNAFLLNLRGQRAFIQSGRRDIYGSPHHTKWMFETKSDNAILVNGAGQRVHTADATGRIRAFETTDRFDLVAGEAGDAYDHLDRWSRRILFFKPGVVLIHDVLRAPEPSTYQWLLHTQDHGFTLDENSARWEGKPGKVNVQFLSPAGLRLHQTNEFETPPHAWANFTLNEWHLTAETELKTTALEFVTLLTVDDTATEASLDENTVLLRIEGEDVKVRLEENAVTVQGWGVDRRFPVE